MRKVMDAIDLTTNEKVYYKGHAKATYLSDGRNVEDALSEVSDSLESKVDSAFVNDAISAAISAAITNVLNEEV